MTLKNSAMKKITFPGRETWPELLKRPVQQTAALESAVQASVDGFKAGKIDITRALLARRDLAIARARRLDLIEAAWRAYADLVVISGDLP